MISRSLVLLEEIQMNTIRRKLHRLALSLPSVLSLLVIRPGPARAQVEKLLPTPQEAEGPFYPDTWTGDIDNDLTKLNGQSYRKGTPMTLAGRILSVDGRPIAAAIVEIWQCDETGKYRHSRDDGEGPANRGFQGFGRTQTNALGEYSFRTIKPVHYAGRPPHVHFKVLAKGHKNTITQMYFAGENAESTVLRLFGGFAKERERLTIAAEVQRANGITTLNAKFDLVLESTA
jgi:protocatechuate 3,4-dioxygenase, beta subunit